MVSIRKEWILVFTDGFIIWMGFVVCARAVFADPGPREVQLLRTARFELTGSLILQHHQPQLLATRAACDSRQDLSPAHRQRRFLVLSQLHPGGKLKVALLYSSQLLVSTSSNLGIIGLKLNFIEE